MALRPVDVGPRIVPLSQAYTDRVTEGGWVTGAKNAKVKIVEYADFQCPACDRIAPILKDAINQTQDVASLEYRAYPLSQHDKAHVTAVGAEAAGRQGKFWEMHDKLFAEQSTWINDTPFSFRDRLTGYAKDLGLDVDQFNRDVDDKDSSIDGLISKSVDAGNAIGLSATPTLLINGTKVDDQTSTAIIEQGSTYLVNLIRTTAK